MLVCSYSYQFDSVVRVSVLLELLAVIYICVFLATSLDVDDPATSPVTAFACAVCMYVCVMTSGVEPVSQCIFGLRVCSLYYC